MMFRIWISFAKKVTFWPRKHAGPPTMEVSYRVVFEIHASYEAGREKSIKSFAKTQ